MVEATAREFLDYRIESASIIRLILEAAMIELRREVKVDIFRWPSLRSYQ
jgi:hypothetical protein